MPMPDWLSRLRERDVPAQDAALWIKCPSCGEMLYRKDLAANLSVCSKCQYHFRMSAYDRINSLVDDDFVEIGNEIVPGDPLEWIDKRSYREKLDGDRAKSNLSEAVVTGFGTLDGFAVALGVMDFSFRGGTMGTVVGERIAHLLEEARERRLPCVIFTASGGARMEEGMLALMQMAKTTQAVERFTSAGNLYVSVLTDPTTGGVSASFAFQSDVIIAEARASIGFAGRRVIEQTVRQRLPDNFQTAEFLLERGQIDLVVTRAALRDTLVRILDYAIDRRRTAPLLKAVPEFAF
ncbi:MAG: acetyl-CoA carboxylase carboxyltransferase subunit beta [Candidatus Eremiobacteraeota bacterium]|nr:acetyl-CoA carboxylase carboxyltransferase subunit beta [Candidatus Eremiobacteraeota bacterium]MBC5803290.1 acetyl-CoA carboxylase carboxyltransferase subunit beta [Candidatus Eremiobacteraeota bacterium]MBC5822182.1 acetyl-CoA carboxylase carboxyltransferase subunit beta [Candidatus Eremiobacteraeota bacterium]